jgi:hypothetical protein
LSDAVSGLREEIEVLSVDPSYRLASRDSGVIG